MTASIKTEDAVSGEAIILDFKAVSLLFPSTSWEKERKKVAISLGSVRSFSLSPHFSLALAKEEVLSIWFFKRDLTLAFLNTLKRNAVNLSGIFLHILNETFSH